MQDDAVIVSAVRTAIGEAGKSLAAVPAWDLAEVACREAIARAGIDPGVLDDVILGETVGGGGNVGRYVGLAVGVPREVPGMTVVRACATGLEAVIQGGTGVWAGVGDAYLVGGCESMSQMPWLQRKPAKAFQQRPPEYFIPLTHPLEMGPFSVGLNTGEHVAERYGVTREQQDEWALRSHQRAVRAIDEGRFEREIVAVPVPQKRGGVSLDDVGLVELNEAFAAMTVACVKELGLDPDAVNVNGGAVSLGHPVGATGARLLVTVLHELERTGGRYGVATMCAGGGLGSAAVIERV